ncbi:hypothetical protein U0070_026477 [Myodes glareolus]|uniref:Uncharacterized protein n=1 Tax=Myodes glareolus TaxID=447135 RepID=A0AAW0JLF3_MYOGA
MLDTKDLEQCPVMSVECFIQLQIQKMKPSTSFSTTSL